MNADQRRSEVLLPDSRTAKFFDITGGIAGLGCVLAAIILFIALPGYEHKLIAFCIASVLLIVGLAAGLLTKLRKTRIVVGVVFVMFFVLSILAAFILSRG